MHNAIPGLRVTQERYLRLRSRLCSTVYRNDPAYRDNTTDLLRLVLNPRGAFAQGAHSWPVTVIDPTGHPLASALLIHARRLPDTLQVGFFEAVNRPDAVDLLLRGAGERARECGCTRVVVGANGHVNNGLGILAGPFDKPPSFGSACNPPYYVDLLQPHARRTETMRSFCHDVNTFPIEADRRIVERAARRFNVRCGRFRNLALDMAVYTDLNNRAFAGHPHYFERTPGEDLELFRAFGPLLLEENFLVAEQAGQPVGFLLWYPDFNEWVAPGRGVGLGAVLRYRLLKQRPKRFKVAELGVLPAFRHSGAALALIARCYELIRHTCSIGESGWILDDNALSLALNTRWKGTPHRTYKVFHLDPGGGPS